MKRNKGAEGYDKVRRRQQSSGSVSCPFFSKKMSEADLPQADEMPEIEDVEGLLEEEHQGEEETNSKKRGHGCTHTHQDDGHLVCDFVVNKVVDPWL